MQQQLNKVNKINKQTNNKIKYKIQQIEYKHFIFKTLLKPTLTDLQFNT